MLPPVAPSGLAEPITTSSTSPGSMPARLTACAMTCPPMSAPWVRLKAPRTALPIGVRAVETMTASTMGASSLVVIPVLVTGIPKSACCGASGEVDPGHKARDDVSLRGSGFRLLPLFLDQLLLRQLADGGLRQGVAEFQVRGQLVAADLVGEECAQLIERKGL